MKIREFHLQDRAACIAVFDSNVPEYFNASERPVFLAFLESSDFLPPRLRGSGNAAGYLHVVESAGAVVGCGGWYLDGTIANLSWGMVARPSHGRGFGRFLLQERVKSIRADGRATAIRVRTTASIRGFFEHAGFHSVRESEGLVKEMPLVELVLALK